MLDIDRFKQLNKRYGLDDGDQVLAGSGPARRVDAPDRHRRAIGGDEFAIVLPETDQHSAFLLAEELLARIRETYSHAAH